MAMAVGCAAAGAAALRWAWLAYFTYYDGGRYDLDVLRYALGIDRSGGRLGMNIESYADDRAEALTGAVLAACLAAALLGWSWAITCRLRRPADVVIGGGSAPPGRITLLRGLQWLALGWTGVLVVFHMVLDAGDLNRLYINDSEAIVWLGLSMTVALDLLALPLSQLAAGYWRPASLRIAVSLWLGMVNVALPAATLLADFSLHAWPAWSLEHSMDRARHEHERSR